MSWPRGWFLAWVLADVSVAAGHTDRSGLGSVLRDLVKPGDENLREMNKKLQNMLEEQLTKNMHLHKASVAYQPTSLSSDTAPGSSASSPFTYSIHHVLLPPCLPIIQLMYLLSVLVVHSSFCPFYPCTHPVIHIQPLSHQPTICPSALLPV